MLREETNITLFEKYRNNELTETELNSFETRIASDNLFKEEFEVYKSIEEGIQNHFRVELKKELKNIDDRLDSKSNNNNPLSIKKIIIWTASAAAILIVSLLAIQNYSSINYQELASNSWEKEPGLPVKMSSKSDFDKPMNAYKLGDYLLAESLLKKFDSDTAAFYLANTQYELNKYSEALDNLSLIEEDSRYYQNAQYKKALILLRLDNTTGCREVLKEISEQSNHQYSQEALSLLNKM